MPAGNRRLRESQSEEETGLSRAGTVLGRVRNGPLLESGAASMATVVVAGGHDHPMAAATIRRLHPDALVDSMGTANLIYGETTKVGEPKLDPYVAFSAPAMGNPGLSCLASLNWRRRSNRFAGPPMFLRGCLLERIGSPCRPFNSNPGF
jgi:sugar (pentulose or hexulose) kinase